MKGFWPILVAALAGAPATQAVPFQDLDFESALLPTIPYGQYGSWVPTSQALPGWSAFLGTEPLDQVLHNSVTLGSAAIWIWGPDWPYGIGGRIEDDFTVVLAAGSAPSGPALSISQQGFVPSESRWLLFKGVVGPTPAGVFGVSLNGQEVPITPLETYADYTLFRGDVSAFAGHEADLRFTVYRGGGNALVLDSIEFSPVPEPAPVALLALGLAGLGLWRCRNRRSPHAKA